MDWQPAPSRGIGRQLLLFLLLLGLVAWFVEVRREAGERQRYPAPGLILTVDGRRVHLYCEGTIQAGVPPVLLEAGAGQSHLVWAEVQEALAAETRVCSYDRAGYGWSDPVRGTRTADEMVQELQALLAKAGVNGPYLLVGQGLGSVIMQRFAQLHPEEVVGMVLVAPPEPSALAVMPEPVRGLLVEAQRLPVRLARWVAPFGGMRWPVRAGLVGPYQALPRTVRAPARTLAYRSQTWLTALAEEGAMGENALALAEAEPLPAVPVTVIVPAGERSPVFVPELEVVEAEVAAVDLHVLRPGLVVEAVREVAGGGEGVIR